MHYKSSELYFYMNKLYDDARISEITAHIESCGECRARLDKVSGIRALFKSTTKAPPAFNPEIYTLKPIEPAGYAFFKPRWAIAFTLVAIFFAAFILNYNFSMRIKAENSAKLIYAAHEAISDIETYSDKYIERTTIFNTSGD